MYSMFSLLVLHLLGASVWVGGHLILLLTVVPSAMRSGDPEMIRAFEESYEKIGVPALVLQVVTGLWLANSYVPGILPALDMSDPLRTAIAWKLILLLATFVIGAHARLFIIPNLNKERLPWMAVHILLITMIALAMLVLGASVRL
ncbi:MAG: CopD family protein [Flavobacteriales bacterium]|nr:CopD family protein [Flavobacteriales bacterium]